MPDVCRKIQRVLVAVVNAIAVPLFPTLGCTQSTSSSANIQQVAPEEAQILIQDHVNDASFVILDVRTPEEFAAGHIAGAINIPFLAGSFSDELAILDKSRTYLAYCASGRRSRSAEAQMSQRGFAHLYDLAGGINQWKTDGFPVVQ